MSRCIVVELRRRKQDERIERFTHDDDPELSNLRRRLRRWSMDNADTLRDANPSMAPEFENRRGDNWRVLLAIADLAGADWGDKARVAADKLEGSSDTSTVGVRLLSAVKVVFDQLDRAEDAISSDELVTKLIAEPTSEWCEWKNGKGITQNQVARLLKSFRIFPERVRISGDRQVRGYLRARFADAWQRYVPSGGI
jgi:hypothetical protein